MNEIKRIKDDNSARKLYEQLLIRREEVKRKAKQIEQEYLAYFGDLLIKIHVIKIDCIELKKRIEYCQQMQNKGKEIDFDMVEDMIQKDMEEYQENLRFLCRQVENSQKDNSVPENIARECKAIFRRLAKLIHPDINPEAAADATLKEVWQNIVDAYYAFDLDELKELEELTNALVNAYDMKDVVMDIPDLDERIAELEDDIRVITASEPYTYAEILNDPLKKKEEKKKFEKEAEEFSNYREELKKIYAKFWEAM